MSDGWDAVVAWSAGISGAGAAIAALLAPGRVAWQHALFVSFAVIAIAAFVILMGAGGQGLVA